MLFFVLIYLILACCFGEWIGPVLYEEEGYDYSPVVHVIIALIWPIIIGVSIYKFIRRKEI